MTQKNKLLHLFRDGRWHCNYELNQICFRYGARIWDLQQEGYVFERKHIGGNEWAWQLISAPESKAGYKVELNGQMVAFA